MVQITLLRYQVLPAPRGGSDDKPVGTVWIAWGTQDNIKVQCLRYNLERKQFQSMVAAICLDLIRRDIMGISLAPRYFKDRKQK